MEVVRLHDGMEYQYNPASSNNCVGILETSN
jgi:hypothetical protein